MISMEQFLTQLFLSNKILAPFLFIIIRSLSVIFPPIPGILIDASGFFIFGWPLAFIYSEIGIMLGAIIAFLIARKFREPLIKRIVPLQKLEK